MSSSWDNRVNVNMETIRFYLKFQKKAEHFKLETLNKLVSAKWYMPKPEKCILKAHQLFNDFNPHLENKDTFSDARNVMNITAHMHTKLQQILCSPVSNHHNWQVALFAQRLITG